MYSSTLGSSHDTHKASEVDGIPSKLHKYAYLLTVELSPIVGNTWAFNIDERKIHPNI